MKKLYLILFPLSVIFLSFPSSAQQPDAQTESNVMHDPSTGVTLRTDSKNYYVGGCLAMLSHEKQRTGSINQGNTIKDQDAWIRNESKKGRAIAEKIGSSPNLFETVKNKKLTKAEAEWFVGFTIYRQAADKNDLASNALIKMNLCEKSGYQKPL
jgi:hypothetical protein